MSTTEGQHMDTGEKIMAFMRGEYKLPDNEVGEFSEEIHKVRRVPVSHFLELRNQGWKNKNIAEMYGLSEMKVRKILKDPKTDRTYLVHEHELVDLMTSRIKNAGRIYDEDGREVSRNAILAEYR